MEYCLEWISLMEWDAHLQMCMLDILMWNTILKISNKFWELLNQRLHRMEMQK